MLDSIKRLGQRGITITELIISISIMAVLSLILVTVFANYMVLITRTNEALHLTVDSQNLLRTMEEEIRYGAGVRTNNTITDPNQPGGWNTGNSNFVIIIAVPVLDKDGNYIKDILTGEPYHNELVYFKSGGSLHKRVLANTCNNTCRPTDLIPNSRRTTCPASAVTATCTLDPKQIDNIDTLSYTLYDQDNAVTTDPTLARSVKIDLTVSKDTFGDPLTLTTSTRSTLRNTY